MFFVQIDEDLKKKKEILVNGLIFLYICNKK